VLWWSAAGVIESSWMIELTVDLKQGACACTSFRIGITTVAIPNAAITANIMSAVFAFIT
jgi:hypothetical protein